MAYEDDYWDSPAYNDFWRGAPGLPPPTKTRPGLGPKQVKAPEELEIGRRYQLCLFNGVKNSEMIILVTGKDEREFSFMVYAEGEVVGSDRRLFSETSMLPRPDGLWESSNYLVRIEERPSA